MNHALQMAKEAGAHGEVPVGVVIVNQRQILVAAANEVMRTQDPTAHAEVVAIRRASLALGHRFLDACDLYVTLEPCPMCCHAISLARLRRVYFGAYDPKGGGVEHGPRLFEQSTCFHKPEIYGGVEEQACGELLRTFFADLRMSSL